MASRTGYGNNTIRVTGYKETARALHRLDKDAKKMLFAGLIDGAQPIVDDARARLSKYRGLSLNTIGARANQRGVFITQGAKKRSSLRPDFGSLQMRKGLLPAVMSHQDGMAERVELAFALLAKKEGF